MTSLESKLAGVNIQLNVQILANQVRIMAALQDVTNMLGLPGPMRGLIDSMKESTEVMNKTSAKLESIYKENPGAV